MTIARRRKRRSETDEILELMLDELAHELNMSKGVFKVTSALFGSSIERGGWQHFGESCTCCSSEMRFGQLHSSISGTDSIGE